MAEPTLLPERLQYRPTKIELDESIEKAKATLLKKIKRSVYVYRVDCGGCNGCEIEIFGSITPVFDVERFGIKVVPSPRHADVLLYTGAVTRAMRMPALRAFEAAPDPKIVVSYGACGCTGGIFYDMMVHDFDMARFLAGSEVTEVFAYGTVLVDPAIGEAGDVDTAVVTLKFANGAMGVIDNSRKAVYGYDQRVEVFGSKGAVMDVNDTPDNAVFYGEDGTVSGTCYKIMWDRYTGAFAAEQQAFADAVINDKPTPVTGEDGLYPILIAAAATKSMKEGRPVKISEIEG